jgi:hypothetical protein
MVFMAYFARGGIHVVVIGDSVCDIGVVHSGLLRMTRKENGRRF